MIHTRKLLSITAFLAVAIFIGGCNPEAKSTEESTDESVALQANNASRVLVFSRTKGYYHESIPSGIAAIQKLGSENGFQVDTTKDASQFTAENLKKYGAIIFLSTTQDVLNDEQQKAMEGYVRGGGGFVGIHAAADTEYDWPWYNKLVGAYFKSHPNNPNVRKATVKVIDKTHPATRDLPVNW